jgi:hypothetical protein
VYYCGTAGLRVKLYADNEWEYLGPNGELRKCSSLEEFVKRLQRHQEA